MAPTAQPPALAPADGSGPAPAELCRRLASLGPLFLRIGRYLASRPDLIPLPSRDALLVLVDHAPPSPWPAVRRLLSEELGGEPEDHFDWISPRPLVSTSLAQTHLGRTRDGREVAVKVQREGIREQVDRELGRGRELARILELAGATPAVAPEPLIEELRGRLDEELDFERELHNLSRLAELAADRGGVRIPRPYPELSGRRVLVHEHLHGVPVIELLRQVRTRRPGEAADLGRDPEVLVRRLIRTLLAQLFEQRFFLADVHPQNLVALPDDAVTFVDFGLAERLDESVRDGPLRYVAAVSTGSAREMYHAAVEILEWDEHSDSEGFRRDFFAAARTWLMERDEDAAPGGAERSPIASFMTAVLRAARRHHLLFPPSLLAMSRALLTAETVAFELAPAADLRRTRERFLSRLLVHRMFEGLRQEQVGLDLLALYKDGPGQLQRLLSDLEDERFTLPVRMSESADDRREANARARMIAAAILAVSFAFLLVGFGNRSLLGALPLWGLFAAALGASYLVVALLWRRLS